MLASQLNELRAQRDAEQDDDGAAKLGREVIELQGKLKEKEALLTSELRGPTWTRRAKAVAAAAAGRLWTWSSG